MTEFHEQYSDEESALVHAFGGHGSSCAIQCACGRTYFNSGPNRGDFEEGELEGLIEKEAKEPDKFISESRYSAITAVQIGGEELIPQCKCEKAKRYIGFLEDHLKQLCEYVAERLKSKSEELKTELAKINLMQASIDTSSKEIDTFRNEILAKME